MLPLPKGPGPVEFVSVTDVRSRMCCVEYFGGVEIGTDSNIRDWAGWDGSPVFTYQPRPTISLTTPSHPNHHHHDHHQQQELKAGKAYTALRVARNDAKLAGIRKGKGGKGGDDKPAGGDE